MAVEKFTKQSWEKWVIAGSIEDSRDDGETIDLASSNVKAWHWDDTEETVEKTSEVLQIASKNKDDAAGYLKIRVQAGDEDETFGESSANPGTYKLTFYIITDQGNQYEVDVKMVIKEK
jgi:hypothetical protein